MSDEQVHLKSVSAEMTLSVARHIEIVLAAEQRAELEERAGAYLLDEFAAMPDDWRLVLGEWKLGGEISNVAMAVACGMCTHSTNSAPDHLSGGYDAIPVPVSVKLTERADGDRDIALTGLDQADAVEWLRGAADHLAGD